MFISFFTCKIPYYWIQREADDTEKIRGFGFFLQPTHYNLYTCWDRYLNVPCACISLFWKHNSFSVDMVPFFSVLIPKHSFDSGSFRSKAHWSLTARLRWTQVCFSEPLLHRAALPRPSVTCMWGFKDGDELTGTISPPLTICHRCGGGKHW